MNLGQVARLLAGFLLFFSLTLLVPLSATALDADYGTSMAFALALAAGLLVSGVLWICGRRSPREMYRKEGLIVVGFAWVLSSLIAAIPFVASQSIPCRSISICADENCFDCPGAAPYARS